MINLRGEWEGADWFAEETVNCAELGLELHHLDFYTHRLAPLAAMKRYLHILESSRGPALVHCRRGADRSSLGAALYRYAIEGSTTAAALDEYQLRYGHVGWALGDHLPHVFDVFADWCAASGTKRDADGFRIWLGSELGAGAFAADVRWNPSERRFEVANRSRYGWSLKCATGERGAFAVLRGVGPGGEKNRFELFGTSHRAEPSKSAVFSAPAGLPRAVKRWTFDLDDGEGIRFRRMGRGGWDGELLV